MSGVRERGSRYEQIADELLQSIESGLIEPGSLIPTIRTLTKEYDVSVNTVVRALDLLVLSKMVVKRNVSCVS